MKNYIDIVEFKDRWSASFDWSHSFIRECYFTTPRHLNEIVDPESGKVVLGDVSGPLNVRLVVASSGNPDVYGVEFLLANVTAFSYQRVESLTFEYEHAGSAGHLVRFSIDNEAECWFISESVLVKLLGKSYCGIHLILGHESPVINAEKSTAVDGCWRRCGRCANIWEEARNVIYSRCPNCGELTELMNHDPIA